LPCLYLKQMNFIYLLLLIIAFISLFISFFSIKLSILFFVLFSFYYFIFKKSKKKYFNIIFISMIIFLINLLVGEGKIIFQLFSFSVTDHSLLLSIKRSFAIHNLFLFSSNIFFDFRSLHLVFISRYKSKLTYSLFIFFSLFHNLKLDKNLIFNFQNIVVDINEIDMTELHLDKNNLNKIFKLNFCMIFIFIIFYLKINIFI